MSSNALSDLLSEAARIHGDPDKPASGRRLADIARIDGYPVSHATLNRILTGTYRGRPSEDTLDAIAHLAGVPRAMAYQSANQPVPIAPLADDLPAAADSLPTRERQLVVELVRVLTARHQEDERRGKSEFEDLSTILNSSNIIADNVRRTSELLGAEARSPEPRIAAQLAGELLDATQSTMTALLSLIHATNRQMQNLVSLTADVVERRAELPELGSKVAEASEVITALEMDLSGQSEGNAGKKTAAGRVNQELTSRRARSLTLQNRRGDVAN